MNIARSLQLSLALLAMASAAAAQRLSPGDDHDVVLESLSPRPDEGLPLGNGILGASVFGAGEIVLSLEHTRLWDRRSPTGFDRADFRFGTIAAAFGAEGPREGRLESLRATFEDPARVQPSPCRLPAGRLHLVFDTGFLPRSSRLSLAQAEVGIQLEGLGDVEIFVHARDPIGRIRVTGLQPLDPWLEPPTLGSSLLDPRLPLDHAARLGYPQAETGQSFDRCWYRQEGANGERHAAMAQWTSRGVSWELCWTVVVSEDADADPLEEAERRLDEALSHDFEGHRRQHREWWRAYWNRSGLRLPEREKSLEAQWYRGQYLHGCAAREGAPPVGRRGPLSDGSLDRLPGDKGALVVWDLPDCYRASLAGNRPEGVLALLRHYSERRAALQEWTRRFYRRPGLNLPALHTPEGRPVGGAPQHAFSSTASCQLACLFAEAVEFFPEDEELARLCLEFLDPVASFLGAHLSQGALELSSSPELAASQGGAWAGTLSNYDHALVRATLLAAIRRMEDDGGDRWANRLKELRQDLERLPKEWARTAADGGLALAPGVIPQHSHRQFSHLVAVYPLGLVDPSRSSAELGLIERSLQELDALGCERWIGSSFAWRSALAARARRGEEAATYLRVFSDAFCANNGVHVGGDQSDRHYSRFRARLPALDGNARAAAALHEMLLQSHTGVLELFPAVPRTWQELEFASLRARGGFLVSARRSEGRLVEVEVRSTAGRRLQLRNPFDGWPRLVSDFAERNYERGEDGVLRFETVAGESYVLRAED